jgi:hypothetical protein
MRKSLVGGFAGAVVAVFVSMLVPACAADEATTESRGSAVTGPPVQSGKLHRWPEGTTHLSVDFAAQPAAVELGAAQPSGLGAFWSVASTRGTGSGFFYANVRDGETRVAVATSARRVADIRDASAYDYSRAVVGPVEPGAIVLVHHVPSGKYLALVLDAIEPAGPQHAGAGPYAYADVSWYLTAGDSADFSGAP